MPKTSEDMIVVVGPAMTVAAIDVLASVAALSRAAHITPAVVEFSASVEPPTLALPPEPMLPRTRDQTAPRSPKQRFRKSSKR